MILADKFSVLFIITIKTHVRNNEILEKIETKLTLTLQNVQTVEISKTHSEERWFRMFLITSHIQEGQGNGLHSLHNELV